jgi:hypothetical protein
MNPLATALIDEIMPQLDRAEQESLKELIQLTGGNPELFVKLLGELASLEYKWKPVDMETFVLHQDYLNLKGQVFPRILDDLVELFDGDFYEFIGFGGIGWGKSTVAYLAQARMVYEVSCLKDPQKAYGLMEGSKIAFINASVNLKQAENVVFHGIKNLLNNSPYFTNQFPYDASLKKELRFPNNIWIHPVAASEGGTVGYNVFGGVLDEVNFWSVVEKSAQNRGERYDQARAVYDMLIRRVKSRFNRGGKLPGVMVVVSSSKYPDDFTEQRVREVHEAEDKKVMIRRYSTWDTKDAKNFMSEKFFLYRGTTADKPFVTQDPEEAAQVDASLVTTVPMDFWPDFKRDIHGSIRDLAGFPTLSIRPFLPQKDKVMDAINLGKKMGRRHPYSVTETTLEDGAYFDTGRCRFDPARFYYAHVDLGLRKDRCGLAVGHVAGWKSVMRRGQDGVLVEDRQPIISIDLMLRIKAPEGGEIQVDFVRALLLELRQYGCNLRKITYDQYQSAGSIQAFNRMGIDAEHLSVDRPMDAYNAMKEAILEDRLVLYEYEPFLEEAIRLEVNEAKQKVDHPPKGSKDVTDAVAGVVFHCTLAKVGGAGTAEADINYGTSNDPGQWAPSSWEHIAGPDAEPTVDRRGRVLPGKTLRTMDDLLFSAFERDDPDEDGDGVYIPLA